MKKDHLFIIKKYHIFLIFHIPTFIKVYLNTLFFGSALLVESYFFPKKKKEKKRKRAQISPLKKHFPPFLLAPPKWGKQN